MSKRKMIQRTDDTSKMEFKTLTQGRRDLKLIGELFEHKSERYWDEYERATIARRAERNDGQD